MVSGTSHTALKLDTQHMLSCTRQRIIVMSDTISRIEPHVHLQPQETIELMCLHKTTGRGQVLRERKHTGGD